MTNLQKKALETLEREFFKYYSYGRPEIHEFKEKHVEEWEDLGVVYVRLEMGLIGDEGTLAEIGCRDTTHVMIGKRGGYFGYRERTHKKKTLSTIEAITWGFRCKSIREKMLNKKEA